MKEAALQKKEQKNVKYIQIQRQICHHSVPSCPLLVGLAPGPGALLGEKDRLDVGQHAALGDGHAGQQLVQLLVVPGQL